MRSKSSISLREWIFSLMLLAFRKEDSSTLQLSPLYIRTF